MKKKNLDKKILAAIEKLKEEGKSPTVSNIQEITGFRRYQIYTSDHKDQFEVRRRKSKEKVTQVVEVPQAVEVAPVVAPVQAKTTDIDLFYKLFGATLTIELKEATPDSIDDAIEDLTFLFKKSVARLQREKYNLL